MLNGIKNTLSLCLQDFINLIHINPKKKGSSEIINLSKELQKEGIIKINQYISPVFADELREEIEDLAHKTLFPLNWRTGPNFNYRNQEKTDGPDSGMLDIFFIKNTIQKISNINQEKIIEILRNATGQEIIPFRANAYLNKGVKNTRGYHIDNCQPVIYKAFIYLSEVPNVSYGPYSFVRRTHRFSFYTYMNLFKNIFSKKYHSSDMTIYQKSRILNAIGKKGDLILSSQNGIHRGLPQQDGKKRVALILNFMIKSRLSYMHTTAKENILKSKTHANKK